MKRPVLLSPPRPLRQRRPPLPHVFVLIIVFAPLYAVFRLSRSEALAQHLSAFVASFAALSEPTAPALLAAQLRRDETVAYWARERARERAGVAGEPCRAFFEDAPLVQNQTLPLPKLEVPSTAEFFSPAATLANDSIASLPLPPKTIFFLSRYQTFPSPLHEESLCAIEAAARVNPSHRIDIWTGNSDDLEALLLDVFTPLATNTSSRVHSSTSPDTASLTSPSGPREPPQITANRSALAELQGQLPPAHFLSRIALRPINDTALFENTPLEAWYASGRFKQSTWVEQNLGNAARLAILYKKGGTYQDLDIVALNELPLSVRNTTAPINGTSLRNEGPSLRRALALQDRDTFFVNNAVVTMPKKDPLIWAAMEEFVSTFRGDVWGWNGPHMISRTLQRRCPTLADRLHIHTPEDENLHPSSEADLPSICSDLAVLDERRYYPVNLFASRDVFPSPAFPESCELLGRLRRESLGLHLWHNHVKEMIGGWEDGSVYREVVARSCPAVAWWRERQREARRMTVETEHTLLDKH